MTVSLKTAEVSSLGTEPLDVLGFKNETELEEALIPLMEEIDQEDLMAA